MGHTILSVHYYLCGRTAFATWYRRRLDRFWVLDVERVSIKISQSLYRKLTRKEHILHPSSQSRELPSSLPTGPTVQERQSARNQRATSQSTVPIQYSQTIQAGLVSSSAWTALHRPGTVISPLECSIPLNRGVWHRVPLDRFGTSRQRRSLLWGLLRLCFRIGQCRRRHRRHRRP